MLMALPFEKATPAPNPPTAAERARREERAASPSPAPRHRGAGPRLGPRHADPSLLETPAPLDLDGHGQRIVDLVAAGRVSEADVHIAVHADLATVEGTAADRRDAAAWVTMRAILDGRQADARNGSELVRSLGEQAGDPDALERYWQQRFWILLEWGTEEERFELLDHCRRRAYWQQDIGWRSALVLLLARMGRDEEAAREFDETAPRVLGSRIRDARWQDMTTNLAEAAAVLRDPRRATTVNRAVDWPRSGMAVVGPAHVCKGSFARFQALLSTATGRWAEADRAFGAAADAHRRAGARPLLARTLREWGHSLSGRDDARSRDCLRESSALASELQLVELLASR